MKKLTLALLVSVFCTHFANAQCSKSGGIHNPHPHYNHHQPVVTHPVIHYRPETRCDRVSHPEPMPEPVHELPRVEVGQRVTLDGRFFGSQPGSVVVSVGHMTLPAEIVQWTPTQAVAVLPQVPLQDAVKATVLVKTAFGRVADQLEVVLLPASSAPVTRPAGPVDPSVGQRPVVTVGQTVTLDGANFGQVPGQVRVVIGALTLNARVSTWSNNSVTAVLPTLTFANAVPATVQVVANNGQVADNVDVTFSPGSATGGVPVAPPAPAFAQR